jgi:flagellar motor switch protein FliM
VRKGGIGGEPAIKEISAEPLREDLREYKKVIIRIRDQKAAEEMKNIPTETLMAKVHGDVGVSQARKRILAVYRLKSGDVILYAKNNAGKKNLKENGE